MVKKDMQVELSKMHYFILVLVFFLCLESSLGAASPFYGCLKDIRIDGVLLDISRPSVQANTELSCPVSE